MKNLVKFAMGAAIAGVLVNMLLKQRSTGQLGASEKESDQLADDMIADTNMVNSGDAVADQRGPQPQDWRSAQNVLE